MPSYTLYFQNRNLLMTKLLVVFAAALVLAYLSEQNTRATIAAGYRYTVWHDWAYVLLVTILVLFAGLRTSYNDTWNYITGFDNCAEFSEWISNPKSLNIFMNPLFYGYQSFLKTWTHNPYLLVFTTSLFSQICLIRFIKRYSHNFTFSIFIYFTLGTFVFSLAAIKQIVAMAILTLAFPCLERKQWVRYYMIVFVAMLVHTYALAFAVLPFFRAKPWSLFTFLFIAVVAAVMLTFEETITAFMEQANDLGKTLADFEVFSDTTINIFRLAVYAVPPLISLIFRRWVLHDTNGMANTLIHMSIISLAFMTMGTQAGANMFGRMGNYFELGTICYLPTMLEKTFDARSYRLISVVACVCFIGFFVYANAINLDFGTQYKAMSLWEFISRLFAT